MQQSIDKHLYRYLLSAALIALTVGTVFYHSVEHLKWVDAYYFSVITLATVGYGDITPHTTAGKIFTTFYVLVGVSIITTFLTVSFRKRAERFEKRRQARNDSKKTQ